MTYYLAMRLTNTQRLETFVIGHPELLLVVSKDAHRKMLSHMIGRIYEVIRPLDFCTGQVLYVGAVRVVARVAARQNFYRPRI